MLTENLQELMNTTVTRYESQHILKELKLNKANAKKIALVGVLYGDISEYITGKELEQFYDFLVNSFDFSSLVDANQYQPNIYKAQYKETMEAISEGWA